MIIDGTLIAELFSFIMVITTINKFVYPKISSAVSNRQKYIEDQLEKCKIADKLIEESNTIKRIAILEANKIKTSIVNDAVNIAQLKSKELLNKAEEQAKNVLHEAQTKCDNMIISKRRENLKHIEQKSISIASEFLKRNLSKTERDNIIKDIIKEL